MGTAHGALRPPVLYDKTAFARAGVDPERPPAALTELRRAAEALKAAGVVHPLATRNIVSRCSGASVTGVDHDDGRSGRVNETTFGAEDTRRVIRWVKAMFERSTTDSSDRRTRTPRSSTTS